MDFFEPNNVIQWKKQKEIQEKREIEYQKKIKELEFIHPREILKLLFEKLKFIGNSLY